MDEKIAALLTAARNILGSGVEFYEYQGKPQVKLWNDRWVLAELIAAVADLDGDADEARQLRAAFPAPEARQCTCDDPFTEESLMCASCEEAWVDGLLKQDADRVPPDGESDEAYARRQG